MIKTKVREGNCKCSDIKRQMITFLREGKFPIDGKLPPLRELSDKFNVSVATLRKAVVQLEQSGDVVVRHGSGVYVSDRCGESVVETTILNSAPGNKTIYVIDAFAKGDLEGHLSDNFVLNETVQGVKESCIKAQWGLKIISFVIGDGNHAIMRRISQSKDKAALIVVSQHFLPMIETVEHMGVPVVSVGPLGVKALQYEVCVDLFEAGYMAGQHLVNLGHENVLYLGQIPSVGKTAYLRHAGFCYIHQKTFLNGKIHEVFVPDSSSSEEEKQAFCQGAQKSLEIIKSVSAIFIASEKIAMVAVPYLLQNGVKIPETVSLVTIDNSRFGKAFTPAWTSVDLNIRGAAMAAAELQISWGKGLSRPQSSNSLAQPRLVLGGSAIQK
ncbi:MAG: hypothetical protein A2Y07_06415 [Planctomycetes bacterium GWF2_50_10]|nr:MAG: hypothetical protein A2Y07_06415 [Planctomycetes bacterium GWF2_50_10]